MPDDRRVGPFEVHSTRKIVPFGLFDECVHVAPNTAWLMNCGCVGSVLNKDGGTGSRSCVRRDEMPPVYAIARPPVIVLYASHRTGTGVIRHDAASRGDVYAGYMYVDDSEYAGHRV